MDAHLFSQIAINTNRGSVVNQTYSFDFYLVHNVVKAPVGVEMPNARTVQCVICKLSYCTIPHTWRMDHPICKVLPPELARVSLGPEIKLDRWTLTE